MPLDPTPITDTYAELRNLRDVLLDTSRHPEGYRWNFWKCETCAMGLLWRLGHPGHWVLPFATDIVDYCRKRLGIAPGDFNDLFLACGYSSHIVTRHMVAAKIDAFLLEVAG